MAVLFDCCYVLLLIDPIPWINAERDRFCGYFLGNVDRECAV